MGIAKMYNVEDECGFLKRGFVIANVLKMQSIAMKAFFLA